MSRHVLSQARSGIILALAALAALSSPPRTSAQLPAPTTYPAASTTSPPPQQVYVEPAAGPSGYTTPPGYAAPPNVRPNLTIPASVPYRAPRPNHRLMIAGLSILGGSYLIAVGVGASIIDEKGNDSTYNNSDFGDCRHCRDVAPWMFLPVAGPFVAMSQTPRDFGLWTLGVVETVGAALTIGGIIRFRNSRAALGTQPGCASWNLGARRSLSLDVASSARMVGPRMNLRF